MSIPVIGKRSRTGSRPRLALVAVGVLALVGIWAAAAAGPVGGDPMPGAKLFMQEGCVACHTIHGQGGKVGPDLSDEGSKGRSRAWLRAQLEDPRKHVPTSPMPSFERLSEKQIDELIDYLLSLKGKKLRPVAE